MLVNSADIALKVMILLKVMCIIDDEEGTDHNDEGHPSSVAMVDRTCYMVEPDHFNSLLAWLITASVFNVVLAMVSFWRCYANNFLHWGAMATWLLLLVQGE